jgi:hypothetical protein
MKNKTTEKNKSSPVKKEVKSIETSKKKEDKKSVENNTEKSTQGKRADVNKYLEFMELQAKGETENCLRVLRESIRNN